MSGDVLTLLCGRCRSVQHIEIERLETVPFWLTLVLEALVAAGVPAILTETCATCLDLPVRSTADLLLELKRTLDGR